MKARALFLIFLTGCGFAAADDPETDLVGRWRWEGSEWGASLLTVSEYRADETYYAVTTARFLGTKTVVTCEGVWKLVDGKHLRVELTKTSDPKNAPVGEVYLMKNLAINSNSMSYTVDDEKERETRLKPSG